MTSNPLFPIHDFRGYPYRKGEAQHNRYKIFDVNGSPIGIIDEYHAKAYTLRLEDEIATKLGVQREVSLKKWDKMLDLLVEINPKGFWSEA